MVLLFGPAVAPPSSDDHIRSLQDKRVEIRRRMEEEGYTVVYGEDLKADGVPPAFSKPEILETQAMRMADMIVVLLGSPGSLVESGWIRVRREFCAKTQLFYFNAHRAGLASASLDSAVHLGLALNGMDLEQVQACQLTGTVLEKARAVHAHKTFLD